MDELTRLVSRNILGPGRLSEMVAGDPGGSTGLSTSDSQNPDQAGRGGSGDGVGGRECHRRWAPEWNLEAGVHQGEQTEGHGQERGGMEMLNLFRDLNALALGRACLYVIESKMRLEA